MKHIGGAVLVFTGTLLLGSPASAQDTATLSVVPAASKRWDASATVGWFGATKGSVGPERDRWYSTASFDLSAGYYWTPHLKTEFEAGVTGSGTFYDYVNVPIPGTRFTSAQYREHSIRYHTVCGLVAYQFFENQWVHPYVGIGVEAARERHHIETEVRPGLTPIPAIPDTVGTRVLARAVAIAGFKFYVSPYAFIRSDVQTSFSSGDTPAMLVWRGGVGLDF
jgi:opacity protein-like surface antigen